MDTPDKNQIKAIETRYAGCRFRSRLEARWAVFFDALGARWEYEPQGYVINGRPYLPDFLLVDCGTWIEVKGSDRDLDQQLMRDAALHLPEMEDGGEAGPRLMVLGPIPEPHDADMGDWGWVSLDPNPFPSPDRPTVSEESYGFGAYHKNRRPWYLNNAQPIHPGRRDGWLTPDFDPYETGCPDAYRAARSARFEHGENVNPLRFDPLDTWFGDTATRCACAVWQSCDRCEG